MIFLRLRLLLIFFLSLVHPMDSSAMEPGELLIVVNRRMAGAVDLAKYYMKKRGIPKEQLVITSLTLNEVMERDEFEEELLGPVRKKIGSFQSRGKNIYGVVTIHGVPLKVLQPRRDWETEELIDDLKREKRKLLKKGDDETIQKGVKDLVARLKDLTGKDQRAAVDSELMLVKKEGHALSGWLKNPYFVGFGSKTGPLKKDDVVLVARLDGPDEETVYRMIDDTLEAERQGLSGIAYFDARWPLPGKTKGLKGYRRWDASLHEAARRVEKRLPVQVDDREQLFAPGSAPDAALYCGWYSLGKYIDAFSWAKGAVGYHIASSECSTLRNATSSVWCLQMLKRGAVATIGPVYEPYVQGFPLPEVFFGALSEGYMDLGESYLVSLPYISWQMVLVGDPLYRPFQPLPQGGKEGAGP